jgi:hypothetical protein
MVLRMLLSGFSIAYVSFLASITLEALLCPRHTDIPSLFQSLTRSRHLGAPRTRILSELRVPDDYLFECAVSKKTDRKLFALSHSLTREGKKKEDRIKEGENRGLRCNAKTQTKPSLSLKVVYHLQSSS